MDEAIMIICGWGYLVGFIRGFLFYVLQKFKTFSTIIALPLLLIIYLKLINVMNVPRILRSY